MAHNNNKHQHQTQEPAPEKQVPQEEQKEEGAAQPEQPVADQPKEEEGDVVLPKLERNWLDNAYDRVTKWRMSKLLKRQEQNNDKKNKKKKILGTVGFLTAMGLAAAGGAAYARHQMNSSEEPMTPELPAPVTDAQPAPDPYSYDCGTYQEEPGPMPDVMTSEENLM